MEKSELKIGMRVGYISSRDIGRVVSLDSNKSKDHIIIEWEVEKEVGTYHVNDLRIIPEHSSELEEEFRLLELTHSKTIKEKLDKATNLVIEACKIADEHGLPFYSRVSLLGQSYVPTSFHEKYLCLDVESVAKMLGMAAWDLGNSGGWRQSQIC